MKPDEIRAVPEALREKLDNALGDNMGSAAAMYRDRMIASGTMFAIYEVAAQLAEIKELLAAKQERAATGKRPKEMKSNMRMNGKQFYVHCWTMTAGEDMLSGFVPNEGQKPISELERTEFTIGTLGSNKGCRISRTQ